MDILDELKTLTKKLKEENIEYALCGGLALAIYALPRATLDIDILIEKSLLERIERIVHDLGYTIKAEPVHFHGGKIQIHRVTKIESCTGEALVPDMLLVTPEIREAWTAILILPLWSQQMISFKRQIRSGSWQYRAAPKSELGNPWQ